MSERKVKRGAIRKQHSTFIGAWVPQPIARAVDQAVELLDLDRSKFVRRALEEKINREKAA